MKQDHERKIMYATVCAVISLLPGFAFAHPGHGGGGFLEGLAHPFTGLDHVVGMTSMGIWASLAASVRQRIGVLMAFLSGMLMGASMGVLGMAPDGVESTLMASVLATGTLLLWAKPFPMLVRVCVATSFALWHGLAHGLEIPLRTSPSSYFSGFLLATGFLLCFGVLLGQWVRRSETRTRWVGLGVFAFAWVGMGG